MLNLISDDPKELEKSIVSAYENLVAKKLSEAEPIYVFLKFLSYVISSQRILINYNHEQNYLQYAIGDNLDALGLLTGTKRLGAKKATCTVRFNRVVNTNNNILIPKGTRVTADSLLYFETVENLVLNKNENYVDGIVVCQKDGVIGNDIQIGAIKQVVDPISGLKDCNNLTVTSNGIDVENDDRFRERILISPETISTAGPKLSYIYYAKSASPDIIDVTVESTEPGEVKIYPLMKDGEKPSKDIKDIIEKILNSDKIRPLTDKVSVIDPVEHEYRIEGTYYLYKNKEMINDDKVQECITNFTNGLKSKLGKDINLNILIADLIKLGVKRVDITSSLFESVDNHELAKCTSINVTFAGLEDE